MAPLRAMLAAMPLLAAAAAAAGLPANGSKPHIVMLVVDDLGWHNVGWHNKDMITPNADKLVSEGVELDRSYVYHFCAPTRSSIMSGRFPYHVNQVILADWHRDWDMPEEMTALPKKLKQAGYATHMVGKWHVGYQTFGQTPVGRGFDTFFGYFAGAEDHWTQGSCIDQVCNEPSTYRSINIAMLRSGWLGNSVDLWCSDKPCYGRNGTDYHMGKNGQVVGDEEFYGDSMYTTEAIRIIRAHDPNVPLFFYIAFQNNHEPLEAPDRYIEKYPADWREDRRWYAGMTTYWDECVGNITQTLKDKGMYDNTLIVLTTDNGGPTYWAPTVQLRHYPHGGGANNWPLRGSKVSNWEGGVRGASFVSGGFLPAAVRGTKLEENLHVTDWYATFCYLAGVDPADPNTVGVRSDGTQFALPPVDSVNVWPLVTGQVKVSPRQEIPVSVHNAQFNSSALIVGEYKLLLGQQLLAYWQGPEFPNGTEPYGENMGPNLDCGNDLTYEGGCLFNIREDPNEVADLAAQHPDILARLKARLAELAQTRLRQEDVVAKATSCRGIIPTLGDMCPPEKEYIEAVRGYQGFVGPWLPSPSPALPREIVQVI